jgi:hypothetical protein
MVVDSRPPYCAVPHLLAISSAEPLNGLAIITIISINFAGSSIQDGNAHSAFKVRNKKAKSFMEGAPGAQEERLGATSLGNEKSR